jgi:hypothetical protein
MIFAFTEAANITNEWPLKKSSFFYYSITENILQVRKGTASKYIRRIILMKLANLQVVTFCVCLYDKSYSPF